MNHKEEFIKLNDEVHAKFPEQITIDLFENFNEDFILSRDLQEKPIERDEIGAVLYDIDVLLEVFDKKFDRDISLLKRLNELLILWYKEIEFRNQILGIPKEKG